jgi:hypothetical protein
VQQLLFTPPPFLTPPYFVDGVLIPSGTAAELDGAWRKKPLPAGPITLMAGGYVLAGLDDINSTDPIRYALHRATTNNSLPADVRIKIGGPGFFTNGFIPPSNYYLVEGVELGPMLFVEPIPEPHGILLAGVGGSIAVAASTRRSRLFMR